MKLLAPLLFLPVLLVVAAPMRSLRSTGEQHPSFNVNGGDNEQLRVLRDLAAGVAEGRNDGHYYGDPADGCAESNEVVYEVKGLEGAWCAPPCTKPYGACPWGKPAGTTAVGECAFQPHPKPAHSRWPEGWRCALICHKGLECPAGASCQIFGGGFGTGTCTYPYNSTAVSL